MLASLVSFPPLIVGEMLAVSSIPLGSQQRTGNPKIVKLGVEKAMPLLAVSTKAVKEVI